MGKLVRTAGVRPTSEGFRVRSRHGEISTTDGPFAESKEVIGGYAIIEGENREDAIELTKQFLEVHGEEWDIECLHTRVRPSGQPDLMQLGPLLRQVDALDRACLSGSVVNVLSRPGQFAAVMAPRGRLVCMLTAQPGNRLSTRSMLPINPVWSRVAAPR